MAWSISNAMMKDYENSLSSQELEAESLEAICSAGEQYAASNTTPTPDQYYWPDKTTEHSRLSRFGMTCVPLTESRGEDLLTWYLAGFPVRTYPSQGGALELKVIEAGFGLSKSGSFAKWTPSTAIWRIVQHSLFEDLELSLEQWPRWGSMRNGVCYQEQPLAPFICEKEFGFSLPTPGKNEGKGSSKNRFLNSPHFHGAKTSEGLRTCEEDPIYLNPLFAELIMMWPLGWTDLQPLETGKFQEWQQQHGRF